jgi:hypothetical protein
MRAILKRLHSPDVDDLASYIPEDPEDFVFLLQMMVGPDGAEGEESFDVTVCSPKWMLRTGKSEDVVIGRHKLIMLQCDYQRLTSAINAFLKQCVGDSWPEVAAKVGRLGRWEFEDYVPAPS